MLGLARQDIDVVPPFWFLFPTDNQVGDARLSQDEMIVDKFLTPWQATLSSSIALAMKARANVKSARLELDTARST